MSRDCGLGEAELRMYVSEVLKVLSGRIVRIDNIGLMLEGVDTLYFAH
jgi:hypothetical protein